MLFGKVVVEETADSEVLRQDLEHGGGEQVLAVARASGIVVGDEARDRDARELVEERQHRLPDRPADVLEVDIDAVRACPRELR